MADMRIVLTGPPYDEPRYYGMLQWDDRNVYIRHPGGGKDSRHGDGKTWLTTTGDSRQMELRVPTSDVTQELLNFVALPTSMPEPPILRGGIQPTDLVLNTSSVGTSPQLAVEIVANPRLPDVLALYQTSSAACTPASTRASARA